MLELQSRQADGMRGKCAPYLRGEGHWSQTNMFTSFSKRIFHCVDALLNDIPFWFQVGFRALPLRLCKQQTAAVIPALHNWKAYCLHQAKHREVFLLSFSFLQTTEVSIYGLHLCIGRVLWKTWLVEPPETAMADAIHRLCCPSIAMRKAYAISIC